MLSALAEACGILGVTAGFEELAQAEVERVIERFAKEEGREGRVSFEDVGEVVGRVGEVQDVPFSGPTVAAEAMNVPSPAPSPDNNAAAPKSLKRSTEGGVNAVKKRRKKGNAIDDLFSGLG